MVRLKVNQISAQLKNALLLVIKGRTAFAEIAKKNETVGLCLGLTCMDLTS